MERFNGVFIAATNLMETLDAASIRRFDLKIHFDYLKSEQALKLLETMVSSFKEENQEALLARLEMFDNLALGDFALIARRGLVMGKEWTAPEWLDLLEQESRAKPGGQRRPMGFMRQVDCKAVQKKYREAS